VYWRLTLLKQQYANVKKQGRLQFTFYERNVQQSNLYINIIFILVEIETEKNVKSEEEMKGK
jgi:hypothetical protein